MDSDGVETMRGLSDLFKGILKTVTSRLFTILIFLMFNHSLIIKSGYYLFIQFLD